MELVGRARVTALICLSALLVLAGFRHETPVFFRGLFFMFAGVAVLFLNLYGSRSLGGAILSVSVAWLVMDSTGWILHGPDFFKKLFSAHGGVVLMTVFLFGLSIPAIFRQKSAVRPRVWLAVFFTVAASVLLARMVETVQPQLSEIGGPIDYSFLMTVPAGGAAGLGVFSVVSEDGMETPTQVSTLGIFTAAVAVVSAGVSWIW